MNPEVSVADTPRVQAEPVVAIGGSGKRFIHVSRNYDIRKSLDDLGVEQLTAVPLPGVTRYAQRIGETDQEFENRKVRKISLQKLCHNPYRKNRR